MADEAPKKKRKSFTRTPKPVFAIVTYTDPASGQPMKLDRDNLSITFEKDASKLVEMLTGEGMGDATAVKVELPTATRKPAGDAPAA